MSPTGCAPGRHPPSAFTAEFAVYTLRDGALQVLLPQRGQKPLLGAAARKRKLAGKEGIRACGGIAVADWAIFAELSASRGSVGPTATTLTPVKRVERGRVCLAFDHDRIVRGCRRTAAVHARVPGLAARVCPREFTIGHLRHVYDTV